MATDEVARQLALLRRGRGLRAPNIAGRVGPAVRQVCGVCSSDNSALVGAKVAGVLRVHLAALPDDLRLAVAAALGLHDAATQPLLKDRLRWAGKQLDREARTVYRRVDAGLHLLAERLTAEPETADANSDNPYAPPGWYTDALRSTVRLDLSPPQLREERTIIATQDCLQQAMVSLTAPGPPGATAAPQVRVRVQRGGQLHAQRQPVSGHYQATIELGRPLAAGERHELVVTFFLWPREAIMPYYLLTPLRPCRRLNVDVAFRRGCAPPVVWRLNGVPRGLIGAAGSVGELVDVDRGRVCAEFHALRQGLSYGLQWQDSP